MYMVMTSMETACAARFLIFITASVTIKTQHLVLAIAEESLKMFGTAY